jgi:nicotinate-nucleotide adenylyltransferase
MTGRRIGIMGGTFDPPHLGHVIPVEIAVAEFDLDLVWFIPAFIPPHKQNQNRTDPYHRFAMLALALENYSHFAICSMELLRGDISFTVDTIRELQSRLTEQDRLFFILGSDSFLELQTWYAPAELLRSCELIIITRGASKGELKKNLEQLESSLQLNLNERVHIASSSHLPFSSTEIRQLIQAGRSVSGMLSPKVESYIQKHSLYRR